MPVRRTEQKKDRHAPYQVLKQASMAAVLSPRPHMHGWQNLETQPSPQNWQQLQPYHHHHHQLPTQEYPPSPAVPQVVVPVPSSSSATGHHGQGRRLSSSHSTGTTDNPWTAEMDEILIGAQARGLRWEQISKEYFPLKSANACRKRFGRAREERRTTDWDEHRINKAIAAYNKEGVRERMWSMLSRETGEKWQDLERWCFSQGLLKMTRGRNGHSRRQSRNSRLSGASARNESRYTSTSNDEYDTADDHISGMGMRTSQAFGNPSSTNQLSLAPGPLPTGSMLHPSHHYTYGS